MTTIRKLPSPKNLSMTLTEALRTRRSSRSYAAKPLCDEAVSTLLWASAGQTLPDGHRTVPSAMGYNAVQAYWIDEKGSWKYDAAKNELTLLREGDFRADTTSGQDFVASASGSLLFVGEAKRAQGLATTLLDVDAGCMVQAAQLAATALGLGSVCRASFDKDRVLQVLGLPASGYTPLIAVTVGVQA